MGKKETGAWGVDIGGDREVGWGNIRNWDQDYGYTRMVSIWYLKDTGTLVLFIDMAN